LTVSTLTNKAFIYLAQLHPAAQGNKAYDEVPGEVLVSREVQDSFTYNVSTSQYILTIFIGIIIDIRALS
jgi:hypothetical protein